MTLLCVLKPIYREGAFSELAKPLRRPRQRRKIARLIAKAAPPSVPVAITGGEVIAATLLKGQGPMAMLEEYESRALSIQSRIVNWLKALRELEARSALTALEGRLKRLWLRRRKEEELVVLSLVEHLHE